MKSQTIIKIPRVSRKISKGDSFFCLGSCFSLEIAKYAAQIGIDCVVNPMGTMYNLHSLYKALSLLFFPKPYNEKDLCQEDGLFFSTEYASFFSDYDKTGCLKKINDSLAEAGRRIRKSTVFFITPGTSVVYNYKGRITANCHRLPHSLFSKRILSVDESVEYLEKCIDLITAELADPHIVLTLSPVRHTPSNLVENSYSKAILRCALAQAAEKKRAVYFPSYEIVHDQMRNYSYFKKDMVHLKKKSVNLIMDTFKEFFFDSKLIDFTSRYLSVCRMIKHKPKKPGSDEYFAFLEKTSSKVRDLEKETGCMYSILKVDLCYRLCHFYAHRKMTRRLIQSLFEENQPMACYFISLCDLLDGSGSKISPVEIKDKKVAKRVDKITAKLLYGKIHTDYLEP